MTADLFKTLSAPGRRPASDRRSRRRIRCSDRGRGRRAVRARRSDRRECSRESVPSALALKYICQNDLTGGCSEPVPTPCRGMMMSGLCFPNVKEAPHRGGPTGGWPPHRHLWDCTSADVACGACCLAGNAEGTRELRDCETICARCTADCESNGGHVWLVFPPFGFTCWPRGIFHAAALVLVLRSNNGFMARTLVATLGTAETANGTTMVGKVGSARRPCAGV